MVGSLSPRTSVAARRQDGHSTHGVPFVSRLLTGAAWGQRSFGRKLAQNLARLLSPLL
jgi:hypothetical protein